MINKNNEESKKNTSVVDEFNKNKRIFKKLRFKTNDIDFLWNSFLKAFKKTFHINKDLYKGLEFGLKIKSIYSKYEIETFDENKKILQIKWNQDKDKYWMKFQIKKSFLIPRSFIKVTEHIYRNTPFFGLQDTAGLMWLKKNFKNEMKNFKQSINIILKNNGEIPEDLTSFYETKKIKKVKVIWSINFDSLIESIKNYFQIKDIESNSYFTSKINRNSIRYFVNELDYKNNILKISWNQDSDKYERIFKLKNKKVIIEQNVSSIWASNSKTKFSLIKKNFKEFINELKLK